MKFEKAHRGIMKNIRGEGRGIRGGGRGRRGGGRGRRGEGRGIRGGGRGSSRRLKNNICNLRCFFGVELIIMNVYYECEGVERCGAT